MVIWRTTSVLNSLFFSGKLNFQQDTLLSLKEKTFYVWASTFTVVTFGNFFFFFFDFSLFKSFWLKPEAYLLLEKYNFRFPLLAFQVIMLWLNFEVVFKFSSIEIMIQIMEMTLNGTDQSIN